VLSVYGPTDLAEGWRTPPSPDPLPVRPVLEAFLGGTPADIPKRYAAASPVTYVTRRAPPTLLIYGARDHIVESRFGRELDTRLKAVGATSIYLEVPWAEHAFDLVPGLSARLVQPYIERFLAANLQ
jgi:acetyl esterase/lipase